MAEKAAHEVAPHCREQFEKGMAAIKRDNFDYAIDILCGLLQLEPAYYQAREALRVTQYKRIKEGRGFFSKMLGKASVSPLLAKAQMLASRKPLEALVAAEQVLNMDPNNLSAHRVLAEAAMAAELPRTALLSLEIVFKQNSSDKKTALALANACAAAGQIGRAEKIYAEVVKANPHDPDLAQALKNLSARRTMEEGGYDKFQADGSSYRNALRNEAQARELEQAGKAVQSEDATRAALARLEEQIQAEPGNVQLLRSLAETCLRAKEYRQAVGWLKRIKESDAGADPTLDKRIVEATLQGMDQQLAALDRDDPDFEDQRGQLAAERQAIAMEAARDLADRYPTDLQLRFELGQLLFQSGRISEAIAAFQKSQNNPHRRVASLGYLGQCFSKRGLHDVAVRTLEKAISEKGMFDDEKKELIFQLGLALEAMGRKNDAMEQFKQIYEMDIGFRDVAARVDAFYEDQAQ